MKEVAARLNHAVTGRCTRDGMGYSRASKYNAIHYRRYITGTNGTVGAQPEEGMAESQLNTFVARFPAAPGRERYGKY